MILLKINSIEINAFRGIPRELDLDLKGKSLLLLGENGTGKSSVIDAVEFFFTGQISHLQQRGPLALKDHGPNAKNPENASVTLVTYPDNHTSSRTFKSNPTIPESLQEDFNLAAKGNFILRRSQILNLITATSSERYKFISHIIGADKLEKIDTAMYQAQKSLIEEVSKKENYIQKITEEINAILEIQDVTDVLPTINQLIENEGLIPLDSIKELDECVNKVNEMTKTSDSELINALNNIFEIIKKILLDMEEINQELSDAENYKKLIMESHDLSELSLIKILKNSLEIIDKDSDKCPLCENKVDSDNLIESINKRLHSLESLKENKDKLKLSLKNAKDNFHSLNKDLIDLSLQMDYFEELKEFNDNINIKIKSFYDFEKLTIFDSFLQDEISIDDFNRLATQLKELLPDIGRCSEELKGSIKPSQKDERLKVLHDLLLDIDEKMKKLDEYEQTLKIAKNHQHISEIIYREFSDIKKRKIQEVYDTVQESVEYYYDILHPKESYRDIKIGIDPNKKGSTNLRMTIFGKEDKDPRSLSSEGHLDSLGICIFLALFKKAYNEFPLLVLDDVVTTMDARHRENVCQLLFQEFGDKQFIITTHDGIWFEQLRAAQRVHDLGNHFKNCTIARWDEDNGPDMRPYKVRWEKIEESIENGDKYCAGNEGRRYLEWLLKDICNRTMAKIPSSYSGKYMVGDLIEPAQSRLLELIIDEEYKESIENSFDKLDKTRMMGNLLSHDNAMEGTVSIDEVERFCRSIHEIHELMLCPNCKAPLGYYRDLRIMRCSNEKCVDPLELKTKNRKKS